MASCRLSNSWGNESWLGMDLYSQKLNSEFCLLMSMVPIRTEWFSGIACS